MADERSCSQCDRWERFVFAAVVASGGRLHIPDTARDEGRRLAEIEDLVADDAEDGLVWRITSFAASPSETDHREDA